MANEVKNLTHPLEGVGPTGPACLSVRVLFAAKSLATQNWRWNEDWEG